VPLYEYRCLKGHAFSVKRSVADYSALEECPVCGGDGTRKYSLFNYTFGWIMDSMERWTKDEPRRNI